MADGIRYKISHYNTIKMLFSKNFEDGNMTCQNLQLITENPKKYTITRIGKKKFSQEIISKTSKNILKNYIYIEAKRIIA